MGERGQAGRRAGLPPGPNPLTHRCLWAFGGFVRYAHREQALAAPSMALGRVLGEDSWGAVPD